MSGKSAGRPRAPATPHSCKGVLARQRRQSNRLQDYNSITQARPQYGLNERLRVTHKALAIRLWMEGKEPTEVATRIHHSLKATEAYLEKFKRVAYLVEKGFTIHETARVVGISTAATRTFMELHAEYRNRAFYKYRKEEIHICGHQYWQAEGEKKSSPWSRKSVSGK